MSDAELTFPLPALRPVPLSRFSPEFGAKLAYAWEMPNGEVWTLKHTGGVALFPATGERLAETLLDLAEEAERSAELPTDQSPLLAA